MSDPIDYIDLTVDSPIDKSLRLRNRNVLRNRNRSDNNTTKPRKRKPKLTQLQDSVMYVLLHYYNFKNISINLFKIKNYFREIHENTYKEVQTMEIIDLDNINTTEKNELICYVDDSNEGNSIVLTCPICYEQLSSKMKPTCTPCGHIFCTQCLNLALRRAKKCPICQKIIKQQSCTRIHLL